MSANVFPRARSRLILATTFFGIVLGRPSRTPCERFTASASRVRCEINLRSNCANVASTFAIASPAGVVVSTAQSSATSAQPCFCAVAISVVKSIIERESRSSFAATSAFASPSSNAGSAAGVLVYRSNGPDGVPNTEDDVVKQDVLPTGG